MNEPEYNNPEENPVSYPGTEDGWQPTQRPKSYGTSAQRLRHGRTTIGKIYGYHEKDVSTEVSQYNSRDSYQNNRHYFLKKRTASSDVIMAPVVEISTER